MVFVIHKADFERTLDNEIHNCETPSLNALAVYCIVTSHIHNITMAGRAYPAVPCKVVFELRE